ncbi:hypothetical protein QBC35DRAFT_553123 [Podospora australis]|uniref:Sexual differentiation process protein n=1 Tax=Podospora australis TaxID=1536484 RepID=A0AAN6WTB2_9PEZI|nr:hypothetical protein QBC35DRAFT_553123 [Podospora australis]
MSGKSEKPEVLDPITVADSVFDGEQVKFSNSGSSEKLPDEFKETGRAFNVTDRDLIEARHFAEGLTLEATKKLIKRIYTLHHHDPNFPMEIISKMEEFLNNDDIFAHPEKYEHVIEEMKIEAALITNNSPYAEVRAVVDNHDDPSLPVSTIRCWAIGILFACIMASVNNFFDIRQPTIGLSGSIPQLLAYPAGKFLERTLPDWGFTLFGVRHSLNPGPFNKKEHMLITIMSSVGSSAPYTNYIVWIQVLPRYFNQPWANDIAYQLLIALSTNFIGYGMAGLCRRFLVYPSYCVWPGSLVTIALNTAFHEGTGASSCQGPFNTIWKMSRMKYFVFALSAMAVYFWFPNYIFSALSIFSWITWIAPNNTILTNISGFNTGLGLNPWPTFDWNIVTFTLDPLMVPFFSTFNYFMGGLVSGAVIAAFYYTNAFHTGHIPILSNKPFDHFGNFYNVTSIVDDRGIFDEKKYKAYSPAFLAASNITSYMFFFAVYSATITYGILYHRREIMMGLRGAWASMTARFRKHDDEDDAAELGIDQLDVHNRLMSVYKEVPEWWYMICLAISVVIGMVAIAKWPTETTPWVVLYGIALCIIFVVPVGIICAMTGVEVTLNVLAEFIGGVWVEGNAISMCFFKTYGYITCSHALTFSSDLKLAHYLKIPPRFTFFAQMVPTLVSTVIGVAILQWQTTIKDVCTMQAPYRFYCPGPNTFFTAAVFWGTIGPKKVWGTGGPYVSTLVGFPFGVAIVLFFWYLNKKFPRSAFLRNTHPVVMISGAIGWAPYNLSYIWPSVPVAAFSWLWLKKRYVTFWSKYNYVTSAAFSCGIAISATVIFFAVQLHGFELNWWGNAVVDAGCEGSGDCVYLPVPSGQSFGPTEW